MSEVSTSSHGTHKQPSASALRMRLAIAGIILAAGLLLAVIIPPDVVPDLGLRHADFTRIQRTASQIFFGLWALLALLIAVVARFPGRHPENDASYEGLGFLLVILAALLLLVRVFFSDMCAYASMRAIEALILPVAVVTALTGLHLLSDDLLRREDVSPAVSGLFLGLCVLIGARFVLFNSHKVPDWLNLTYCDRAELSLAGLLLVTLASLLISSSVCGFLAGILSRTCRPVAGILAGSFAALLTPSLIESAPCSAGELVSLLLIAFLPVASIMGALSSLPGVLLGRLVIGIGSIFLKTPACSPGNDRRAAVIALSCMLLLLFTTVADRLFLRHGHLLGPGASRSDFPFVAMNPRPGLQDAQNAPHRGDFCAQGSSSLEAMASIDQISWSPDGRRIAFACAYPDCEKELYVMKPDGSGLMRVTSFLGAFDMASYAWSPDSRSIAMRIHRNEGMGFILAIARGRKLRHISPDEPHVGEFVWLPDGKGLVYDDGGRTVYFVSANEAVRYPLSAGQLLGASSILVTPDGRRVFYTAGWQLNEKEAYMSTIEGSEKYRLTQNAEFDHIILTSSDGRKLLLQQGMGATGMLYLYHVRGDVAGPNPGDEKPLPISESWKLPFSSRWFSEPAVKLFWDREHSRCRFMIDGKVWEVSLVLPSALEILDMKNSTGSDLAEHFVWDAKKGRMGALLGRGSLWKWVWMNSEGTEILKKGKEIQADSAPLPSPDGEYVVVAAGGHESPFFRIIRTRDGRAIQVWGKKPR